jgi:hypothetical protein
MTSQLTYLAARSHLDDLLREAADRQCVPASPARPHALRPQVLRRPRRGLAQLRQLMSGTDPRTATHESRSL